MTRRQRRTTPHPGELHDLAPPGPLLGGPPEQADGFPHEPGDGKDNWESAWIDLGGEG
jgi:hypothetical protein